MLTSIDLFYLMRILLPTFIRQPKMLALLIGMKAPIENVQLDLYTFFALIKYELAFNGQVMYLEHILNDVFDNDYRRIYITDGSENPMVYIFNQSELNEDLIISNTSETEIPPVTLYNFSESEIEVDFIVNVPESIIFDENLMRFIVNKYRIAPKRFSIVTFTNDFDDADFDTDDFG